MLAGSERNIEPNWSCQGCFRYREWKEETAGAIVEAQSSSGRLWKFQAAGIAQSLFRALAGGFFDAARIIASGALQIFCKVPEAGVGGFNASLAAL